MYITLALFICPNEINIDYMAACNGRDHGTSFLFHSGSLHLRTKPSTLPAGEESYIPVNNPGNINSVPIKAQFMSQ